MCAVVTLEVGAIILPRALISLSIDLLSVGGIGAGTWQIRIKFDCGTIDPLPRTYPGLLRNLLNSCVFFSNSIPFKKKQAL